MQRGSICVSTGIIKSYIYIKRSKDKMKLKYLLNITPKNVEMYSLYIGECELGTSDEGFIVKWENQFLFSFFIRWLVRILNVDILSMNSCFYFPIKIFI